MKTKLINFEKIDRAAYAKYRAAHHVRWSRAIVDIGEPMSFEKWLDIYSSRASRRVW